MISNIEVIYGLANRSFPYGLKKTISDPDELPLEKILKTFDGVDGAEKYKWSKNDINYLKISKKICNFTKIDINDYQIENVIKVIKKHSSEEGSIYLKGLYIHNEISEEILKIYNSFRPIIKDKFGLKLGFSIYKQEEIDFLIRNEVDFEILQIPRNINVNLDVSKLQARGCEIYLRSIFLQGAYFANLTNKFNKNITEKIDKQKKYLTLEAESLKLTLGEYLFSEAISACIINNYKGIVIGSSSLDRLNSYFTNYKNVNIFDRNSLEISDIIDTYLADPRQWKV